MKKILIAYVFIEISFSSCQKVPQAEIDTANNVISEVKATQADLYQPAMYAAIQDSMKVVNELVEVQKSKWFKKYDAVRVKLANINTYAVVVKDSTESRKAAVKAEAETTLAVVKAFIEEDKALLAKAPIGKEGKEALEQNTSEITLIEGSVNEISSLIENGDYIAAIAKIKSINEKATSINLTKAQLGFSYYKVIRINETRDFRVNVIVNGTRSTVKSNIREIERHELEYADLNDSSIVCYINNIDFYDTLKITLEADTNDFKITPFDKFLKEEQKIDFIKGNNWHWRVKAVANEPHNGFITLRTEVIPRGEYMPTPKIVTINIVINPPLSLLSVIFNWIVNNIITTIVTTITSAFAAYLAHLLFKKNKEKEKRKKK
jgi:hypothetical protein